MYVSLVKRNNQVTLRLFKDDGLRYFDPIYSWFKILHSKYDLDKDMIIKRLRELDQGAPNDVSLLLGLFVGDFHESETDPTLISDHKKSPYLYSTCNQMMQRYGDNYLLTLNLNLNSIRGVKVDLLNSGVPMKIQFDNAVTQYTETLGVIENKIKDIATAAMSDLTGDFDYYVGQFTQCIEGLFHELREVAKLSSEPDKLEITSKMIINDLIMGVALSVPVISDGNNWGGMLLSETSPELFIETFCNFGKAPEIETLNPLMVDQHPGFNPPPEENPIVGTKDLEIPSSPNALPEPMVAGFEYKGTMINIQSTNAVALAAVIKELLG